MRCLYTCTFIIFDVYCAIYFCLSNTNTYALAPVIPMLLLILISSLNYHRLLLMEEHSDRLVVHAVIVWHDQQVWKRAGGPSYHDTGQSQGGSRVRVCIKLYRLWCKETDSLCCINADQRNVLHSLMFYDPKRHVGSQVMLLGAMHTLNIMCCVVVCTVAKTFKLSFLWYVLALISS